MSGGATGLDSSDDCAPVMIGRYDTRDTRLIRSRQLKLLYREFYGIRRVLTITPTTSPTPLIGLGSQGWRLKNAVGVDLAANGA